MLLSQNSLDILTKYYPQYFIFHESIFRIILSDKCIELGTAIPT